MCSSASRSHRSDNGRRLEIVATGDYFSRDYFGDECDKVSDINFSDEIVV